MSVHDIKVTDPFFLKYIPHVLKWEGKKSKDQRDTAAPCAPFKGGYHTNKGVTFCTFKKVAPKIGINPVSYDRFLNLTDADVKLFVFHFCQEASADILPIFVSLAVTEAAWGSGPNRAIKHLQESLKELNLYKGKIDGVMGAGTRAAALKADAVVLYRLYWKYRRQFIDRLVAMPKYAMWKNGWYNRINDFLKLFPV